MGDDDSPPGKFRGTFLRPNSAVIKGLPTASGVERPKVSHRRRELNFLQKLMTRFDDNLKLNCHKLYVTAL